MNIDEERLYKQLLDKSQEAFTMAIEIYNKPTIKYRVEAFSFMICNAWELMLKAKIIKDYGEDAIYYKDNKERTKSLSNCISMIFTNETSPSRKNLEEIISLRDTSTHFITQEYELIYVPLFQSCVNNYTDKMYEFHGVDITKQIPTHFLNLSVGDNPLTMNEIQAKYSKVIVDNLLKHQAKIENLTSENHSEKFAIVIRQDLRLVKSKDSGVPAFRYVKDGEQPDGDVMVIKQIQDPNITHPYSLKKVLENVKTRLKKLSIEVDINKNHIQEYIAFYNLKAEAKYCFTYKINGKPTYSYSAVLVDLIVAEVQENSMCFTQIHSKILKSKQKN